MAISDARIVVDKRGWDALKRRVQRLNESSVRVGVVSEQAHDPESGIGMAELAAIHEFGSPAANIPERSFIRRTLDEKRDSIATLCARLTGAVVEGKMDEQQALGLLGAYASGQIRTFMLQGPHIPPPLKPATIARKGSDRPLVDTGRLAAAISWLVVRGGDEVAEDYESYEVG